MVVKQVDADQNAALEVLCDWLYHLPSPGLIKHGTLSVEKSSIAGISHASFEGENSD
jgi:hypothetical protein